MATCTVSGILQDVSGTAVSGATVRAKVVNPFFSTTIHIMPKELSTTTNGSGAWSLTIIQGCSCIVTFEYPPNSTDSNLKYSYSITVPASSSANFSTLATEG